MPGAGFTSTDRGFEIDCLAPEGDLVVEFIDLDLLIRMQLELRRRDIR